MERGKLPAAGRKTCLDTFREIATIRPDKAMDLDVDPTVAARQRDFPQSRDQQDAGDVRTTERPA
jgi:hypothetical protein